MKLFSRNKQKLAKLQQEKNRRSKFKEELLDQINQSVNNISLSIHYIEHRDKVEELIRSEVYLNEVPTAVEMSYTDFMSCYNNDQTMQSIYYSVAKARYNNNREMIENLIIESDRSIDSILKEVTYKHHKDFLECYDFYSSSADKLDRAILATLANRLNNFED